MYCEDNECEKRIKGYCRIPTKPLKPEDEPYSLTYRCTCKGCDWSEFEAGNVKEPCEFIGDPYNIDGDCLALK